MADPTRPPGIRYYACNTLMGNWFEDRIREDEEYKEYKKKQALYETNRASLATMGMLDKFIYISGPERPSIREQDAIYDGDHLMLFNHNESAKCLCTDPRYFVKGAPGALVVTISSKPKMVSRSMFTVRIPDDDPLTYGSVFALVPSERVSVFVKAPLALTTWMRTPDLQPKTRDAQCVGFAPYDEEDGTGCFNAAFMFRAEYPDPELRMEMEGLKVRPGDLLVIRHCRTGRTLVGSSELTMSDITPREQEVVCATALDQYRRELQCCMWTFEAPGVAVKQASSDNNQVAQPQDTYNEQQYTNNPDTAIPPEIPQQDNAL